MKSTPTNLIVEHGKKRLLVPWTWLLRVHADEDKSTLVLTFSGLRIFVTTLKPTLLLESIEDGNVHRIKVTTAQDLPNNCYAVDAVDLEDQEDEE